MIDSTRHDKSEEGGAAASPESRRRLSDLNEKLQEIAEHRHRQLGAAGPRFRRFLTIRRIG